LVSAVAGEVPERIEQRLLTQHRHSIGPLFPGEKDMALLRDVRNFLTHYETRKASRLKVLVS
jgi:hypothetical protein